MVDAQPFGFGTGLVNQVDRGAGVKDVIEALIDQTLCDEKANDCLTRTGIERNKNIVGATVVLPAEQGFILTAP